MKFCKGDKTLHIYDVEMLVEYYIMHLESYNWELSKSQLLSLEILNFWRNE